MRFYIKTIIGVPYFYVIDDSQGGVIATFDDYEDAELFCLAKNGLLGV